MSTALHTTPGTLAACPVCPRPTRVLEAFSLSSTSGAVDHVRVTCPVGHWFTMPADRLVPLELPAGRRAPQG